MTRQTARKLIKFYQHHEVSTSRRYHASSGRTILQDIAFIPTTAPVTTQPPLNHDAELAHVFLDDSVPEVIEHQISGCTVVAKVKGDDPRKRYECTVSLLLSSNGDHYFYVPF